MNGYLIANSRLMMTLGVPVSDSKLTQRWCFRWLFGTVYQSARLCGRLLTWVLHDAHSWSVVRPSHPHCSRNYAIAEGIKFANRPTNLLRDLHWNIHLELIMRRLSTKGDWLWGRLNCV